MSARSEQKPNQSKSATARKKGWRNRIMIHPAAAVWPDLSPQELEELATDIKANGLDRKPVCFQDFDNDGKWTLLDGKNRADAMEALGFRLIMPDGSPNPEYFDIATKKAQDNPRAYVVTVNGKRRHLDREQRRSMIAWTLKAKPSTSSREIARVLGFDHKTVGSVRMDMVARGEIPHAEHLTNSTGREQPAHRAPYQPRHASGQTSSIVAERQADLPAAQELTGEDIRKAALEVAVREFIRAANKLMEMMRGTALQKPERLRLAPVVVSLRLLLNLGKR